VRSLPEPGEPPVVVPARRGALGAAGPSVAARRVVAMVLGVGLGSGACAPPAASAEPEPEPAPVATEAFPGEQAVDPIRRWLAADPVSLERQEEILDSLRSAIAEFRAERHAIAAHRADSLLALLPTLEDWRPLIRAELLAPSGDTAGVRSALRALDPGTPLEARWGWSFLVEAHAAAGDSVGAYRTALRHARSARTPRAGAAPWLEAGRLALAMRDTIGARAAFLAALHADPDAPTARSAAQVLDGFHAGSLDERLMVGRALLAAGQWSRALALLAGVVEDPTLSEVMEAELRLGLGRGLVELRRPAEALAMLAPLTGATTPGELAAPALFWSGRAHLARNANGEALQAFEAIARRMPGDPRAEEGFLILLQGAPAGSRAAAALLEGLLDAGVGSAAGEVEAVRFGTGSFLSGDYQRAAVTFERYLENARRPASRQQAAYWAALARERGGDPERARAHLQTAWEDDPLSFYGVLAGERLDVPILPGNLPAGPAPAPGLGRELENALLRLRVHQVVPTNGSFALELDRLQDHFFQRGDGAYDLAEALIEGGFPIQGVVLGREIHRREGAWNLRLLRIVHPFPYRDTIVREARARGLDPFFVAGLIRQESLFHNSIRSSAGAVGLMQLMPGTAQEVARSMGIRYSAASLADPDYNVRLGTQYLASMIRRYDGRAQDALSAYNAGPTRINQWRQRPESRDRDVFVEHIPFRETRHYVKVVQQYARVYAALYGCPGYQPCLGASYSAVVARSPYAGGAPVAR
jgi:soluble lytic murein transglycosylase